MLKRIVVSLVILFALIGLSSAEVTYTKVSATDVSSNTILGNATSVVIINDGTDVIYFRLFYSAEPTAASTSAKGEIKSGESLEFERAAGYSNVSIICAAGKTATVRIFYQTKQ